MANTVAHWEVSGHDAKIPQQFYADLLGWKMNPAMPDYYLAETGGVDGGIGQGEKQVTFYVGVPDLQASLAKVESLGGKVIQPITEIPGYVTLAMFTDPEDNAIGLIKGTGER